MAKLNQFFINSFLFFLSALSWTEVLHSHRENIKYPTFIDISSADLTYMKCENCKEKVFQFKIHIENKKLLEISFKFHQFSIDLDLSVGRRFSYL